MYVLAEKNTEAIQIRVQLLKDTMTLTVVSNYPCRTLNSIHSNPLSCPILIYKVLLLLLLYMTYQSVLTIIHDFIACYPSKTHAPESLLMVAVIYMTHYPSRHFSVELLISLADPVARKHSCHAP